jgi:uncharacterized membrane protein YqjE
MISNGSSPHLAEPGSVPRVVVEALMHRGELASVELREARLHAARTAAAAALAGALLLLGGFAGTFAVAAAVWGREDRGLILGLLALAYVAGAAALGFVASRRLSSWQPFAETFRQLHEDCAFLHRTLADGKR